LVTLGLVLDGSGFVRRSQTFAGNVSEPGTLASMLAGLGAPAGALVVMDAGIATDANVAWLVEHGYRYLVVRRGGMRQFDETPLGDHRDRRRGVAASPEGAEPGWPGALPVLPLAESATQGRGDARAILWAFRGRLAANERWPAKAAQRKESTTSCWNVSADSSRRAAAPANTTRSISSPRRAGKTVTAITWQKVPVPGTMATHPGVYCLRTNELAWDEEKLWRTYTMLTDLESVFRSLKSELGLRPIYHHKEVRSDGHLFITVLAYQCVQFLRVKLKAAGITDSWATLRDILSVQRRVTATFSQRDGRSLHVRKATVAEPDLLAIYRALGISAAPGGTRKLIS
jgi:hypothetical protein